MHVCTSVCVLGVLILEAPRLGAHGPLEMRLSTKAVNQHETPTQRKC